MSIITISRGSYSHGKEIAEAVKFILDAPAITGQMIAVDGGQHLGWTTGAAPDQFD